jgi:hypothetical protein
MGTRSAEQTVRDIRRATRRQYSSEEKIRTVRAKGCLSNRTALAMVFKLVDGAQKTWRRLNGPAQLPKIIQGVKFSDGLEVAAAEDRKAETAAA